MEDAYTHMHRHCGMHWAIQILQRFAARYVQRCRGLDSHITRQIVWYTCTTIHSQVLDVVEAPCDATVQEHAYAHAEQQVSVLLKQLQEADQAI